MIILKKKEELDDILKKEKVLLDFYADWCGPCKVIGPILEEIDKEVEDLEVVKINSDDFLSLARDYKVMSIPSLKYFENGKMIKEHNGIMTKDELLTWLDLK